MGAGPQIYLVNRKGILYEGREGLAPDQAELCKRVNPEKKQGALADANRPGLLSRFFNSRWNPL